MMLAIKIIAGFIALGLVGFFVWFIHLVVMASMFDNRKCKNCPMKEQCQDAVTAGLPTLCNNSTPLYTRQSW